MTRKPTYEDLEQRIRVLEEESIIIKQAEESLRESEEKYRILLSESPDPTFSFTPEGQYRYVNRAFAEGVGKPVEDIIGKSIWDVFPKEEADMRFASLSQVFHTGKEQVIEVRVPRADGDRYYITTITLIKDTEGEILSAICSSKDITDRKLAEEALHRSEIKFRTLYDSTIDAVMLLEEKGFIDCNKATLSIFGCTTREEFCQKHPAILSPPQQPCGTDSIVLANQMIAEAMGRGSIHFEWMHKRNDTGETFPADVLLTAMEMDGKQVVQAVVRDITERKQAEEKSRNML
ncbi:MAG: PAS domain S-box protein, partial [Syntrophus sp. (in: bacteria)]